MKRHHSKIQEIINPNEVFSLIGLKKHLLDGKDINDFDVKTLYNKIEKKAPPKESKVLGKWTAYNICKPVRRPKLILNTGNHTNISNNLFEVTENVQSQLEYNILGEINLISTFTEAQEHKTKQLHSFNNFYASSKVEEIQESEEVEIDFSIETQNVFVFSSSKKCIFIRYKELLEHIQLPPVSSKCDFEEYLFSKNAIDINSFITILQGKNIYSIKKYFFIFYLKQWYFVYLNFKKYYREKPFT